MIEKKNDNYTLCCSLCDIHLSEEQQPLYLCPQCRNPLEVNMELPDDLAGSLLDKPIEIKSYLSSLPIDKRFINQSMGEGGTPLYHARRLAQKIGFSHLFIKNEALNPSGSFKDRAAIMAIKHAFKLNHKKIAAVSSLNMAKSVAMYGAFFGLQRIIFLTDSIDTALLRSLAPYKPQITLVSGEQRSVWEQSIYYARQNGVYIINSDVPMAVEGVKIIAYEIWQQLAGNLPDWIVIPVGCGGLLRAVFKGFNELTQMGAGNRMPGLIAVQANRCSPLAAALAAGRDRVTPFILSQTVAREINDPFPTSGNRALSILQNNRNLAITVSDNQTLVAQKLLADFGFFVQPSAAAALAGLLALKEQKAVKKDAKIVLLNTGGGTVDDVADNVKYTRTKHIQLAARMNAHR